MAFKFTPQQLRAIKTAPKGKLPRFIRTTIGVARAVNEVNPLRAGVDAYRAATGKTKPGEFRERRRKIGKMIFGK